MVKLIIPASVGIEFIWQSALELLRISSSLFWQEKMDIKKDKKGLVYVQGSIIKEASNSKELFALFEEGSKNRHTASTSKLEISWSFLLLYVCACMIIHVHVQVWSA